MYIKVKEAELNVTDVTKYLDQHNIEYSLVAGEPSEACSDVARCRNIKLSEVGKCLVYKRKKESWHSLLIIIIIPGNRFFSEKKFESEFKYSIKMAPMEKIKKKFPNITKGTLSPPLFSNMQQCKFFYDESLLDEKKIDISSGNPTFGCQLSKKSFLKLVEKLKMKPCNITGKEIFYPGEHPLKKLLN
ncbi:YbaK/aminoacyl-tRNA synthetase associated region domain protein [Candidatus Magnetomorum sp. HK-1]|nr:YbaK/aminoacyl-tRNA synthetase associated region domain protein [Candidatus Magnetomorum sp. HK-1]